MKILLLPLCLLMILSGCAQNRSQSAQAQASTVPMVRVRVLEKQTQVLLEASEPPLASTTSQPEPAPLRIDPGTPYAITYSAAGWSVGGSPLGTGTLTIQPAAPGTVSLQPIPAPAGKDKDTKFRHRGSYRLVPAVGGTFDVINDIDVEQYLQGVITREMLVKWHPEALRAQAIIARTYALYEVQTNPSNQIFDLFTDTRSQVYGGINSETPQAIAAVQSTTGIVCAYGANGEERIFKTYFSSCCGGVSQASTEVFGGPPFPPLAGRANGALCSTSPKYSWKTAAIPKAELTKRFRAWALSINAPERNMGEIERIEVQTLSPFGRPTRFLMTDSRNNRFSMRPEDLRHALNFEMKPAVVSSSFVVPINNPTTIQFNGHGSGHGVGMCQYCSEALARQGSPHETIIFAAYPHTKLIRAY